ncbi:polysaccharide pyruvyl transferase family protein [Parapedobacter koreensis]|nr:polysaccharide pyruvyl transferase family protein [Parapedobacter koreensis]
MLNRQLKIGISGSYGGMNLGDEAILQVMLHQIKGSLDAEITVFSRHADDTNNRHQADNVVSVRDLSLNEIKPYIADLDLFILGGGGILYDQDILLYLREVKIANEQGVPVMLYAIGAGPLENRSLYPEISDTLNKVNLITVRDVDSKHLLESIGVTKAIHVTTDPAFLLTPEPIDQATLVKEQLNTERRLIAMSVREPGGAAPDLDEEKYHSLLANAADYMVDRFGADILFIPTERHHRDLQHSHAVISLMLRPQYAHVLKGEYSPGQLLSIMKHCDFAVGMRLHFLIFAALQNVPFVALPYAAKVKGLLSELGIDMPPLHLVNAGRLIAYIDQFWDNQEDIRKQISEKLPAIQTKSKLTHQLMLDIMENCATFRC